MRNFSAFSTDHKRLYLPLDDGTLLLVTREGLLTANNGENEDAVWVEHPNGSPFGWSKSHDTRIFLSHFERWLVDTQACQEPAMRWFVAMHEGLFPFVRDLAPARFLVVHIGDSQTGKTTGAERFTLLHGLGSVKGDYSVAALGNTGDIGLLAMDNKEQTNLTPDYIDFLLFLATGAARGRSYKDGRMRTSDSGRPVGVITSIEGVGVKTELKKRLVEVRYAGNGLLNRSSIEELIGRHRNSLNSALAAVLQRFLIIHPKSTPNPLPGFEEHFRVLCNLLSAYGDVSGKPAEWSEQFIESWVAILSHREVEEDALEYPLRAVLQHASGDADFQIVPVCHKERRGKLYVTDCGALLRKLLSFSPPIRALPDTPSGLGRRLRSTQFNTFEVLDDERAPDLVKLKRTPKRRPIGFFLEDDTEPNS
jgi:hypothetical protein